MRSTSVTILFALGLVLLPREANALTLPQAVGLFHIVVGLLLAATILLFITAFCIYVARFNTWPSHRDSAIRALEWAVMMLFVLLVILAIVNAIQHHGSIALPILAFILIVILAIVIIRFLGGERKKPAPPNRERR